MVFAPSEVILGPLAARQELSARAADRQAAENDTTLAVAEAYFAVQRARGELAGAVESERVATDLAERAEKLAAGLTLPVEASRARTELSRRRQAVGEQPSRPAQARRQRPRPQSGDSTMLARKPLRECAAATHRRWR